MSCGGTSNFDRGSNGGIRLEHHPSLSLGLVYGSFAFCWNPFFVLVLEGNILQRVGASHLELALHMAHGYVILIGFERRSGPP